MDFEIELVEILLPVRAVQEDPNEEPEYVFREVTLHPGKFVIVDEDLGKIAIQPRRWRSDIRFWVGKEELTNKSLFFKLKK